MYLRLNRRAISKFKYPIRDLKILGVYRVSWRMIIFCLQVGVQKNKHSGVEKESQLDDDGDGLHCVQWSHQKASVVCEALLSRCIASPSATHTRSLLTLPLSFHHSQHPSRFPGSTHLPSLRPARRSRLVAKVIVLLSVHWPGIDLHRLAEVLQKARIIISAESATAGAGKSVGLPYDHSLLIISITLLFLWWSHKPRMDR